MASIENFFLPEQIDLLDRILAASTDHVYVFDRGGRSLYGSPTGLVALGIQAEELLGKNWRELNFPTEVMECQNTQWKSVFQTGIPIRGETSFPTAEGLRYYEYVISPLVETNGEINAVINTNRDITERKKTEAVLREFAEELEARVTARTKELTALNQALQTEILERQKAEQALQESEIRFKSLVEAIFEGIVVQENGEIIDANSGFARMFGYSLEEVIGKSAIDFLTTESVEVVLYNTAICNEFPYEVTGIKKDGTQINLEVVGKQSLYQGRSVRVSAARDITERKRAEAERVQLLQKEQSAHAEVQKLAQQLEAERSRLEQVLQQMPVGVEIAETPSGKLLFHNEEAVRLLRHPLIESDTYQGYVQYGAIHADGQLYQPDEYPIARSLLSGEVVKAEEMRYRRGDGTTTLFAVSAAPILNQAGDIVSTVSTFEDISERKQTERALQVREARLQRLAANVVGMLYQYVLYADGCDAFTYVSPKCREIYELEPEELLQDFRQVWAMIHPDDVERVQQANLNSAQYLVRFDVEFRLRPPSGCVRWVRAMSQPERQNNGDTIWDGMVLDITDHKQAEIALREKEQQLQQLSDSMPQFVWMNNAQGETEYVNRQWLEYSGLTVEQSHNAQKVAEFLHPEEAQFVSEQWGSAQVTQQPFEIEARLRRASDGIYRWFLMRSVPVLDELGTVVRWYGTSTDIHDRKVAQLNEQFLTELDLRLRQLSDADAMVWEAISSIGEYLNVERCVWHEINVQEDLAIVTQDWRQQANISSVVGVTRLSESILPDMLTQFHAGQPAVVSDVATHPYTAPFAQNFAERDIRAFVGIPCLYEGRWVAVLAINARTPQEWRSDQVALLQDVVARLWSLIEHTRAVQVLQEQEERTRLATEAADLGMWFWDLPQDELVWTDRCKALFGIAPDVPMTYEVFLNAVHPDDREFTQAAVTQALEQKVEYNIEYRTIWPDRSIHWIAAKGRAFYDANGQPIRMMGTAQEISDHKRTEAELRERERLFSTLAEALPVTIFRFDVNSHCTYINNYWTAMTGRTANSAMGLSWLETLHPEDRDRLASAWLEWSQDAQQRGLYQNEGRLAHMNGQDVWYYIQALPEVNDNGDTTGYIGVMTDITERKQTEQTLQEREAVLRLFVQNAPTGIAMFDREMHFLIGSQRWADDYYHGALELMIGRSHYDLFPDLPDRWRQIHQRCLAGAIEKCDEDLFVRADGWQQWTRWETRPWYTATNEIGGIIIFAEDITQRKQSETAIVQLNQELQQKVTELQTLLDVIPIGIGIAEDPECQRIRVNPAFADALGILPTVNASLSAVEEERPTTFQVYQNGREVAPEELPLQYAATHGVEIRDLEIDVVWQDGTTITLLEYAAPLLDASGQLRGSVGAFLNITDRKQSEQALRDSEQQLTLALQAAKAGAWTWELATNRLYWSDEYYRVFGLEPSSIEPSYENGFSRLHPDDQEWVEREMTQAIAQGKNTNIEYRILLPDGTPRWVVEIGQMFYDELNQPTRMAGIVVDITERKQAEAALRESQERYRTLAQNFPNGAVLLFDKDLRYVLAEGQGLAQVGLDKTSLEGKNIWEVLDPQTCRVLEPLYKAALAGDAGTLEIPFGDRIYFAHCLPVFDDQGFVKLGMLVSQDITLQKQAEQVLRTARDELERQVQERTSELQEANTLLAQREREFRALVENTPDVITRHDRQHRCLYINPACIPSLGMPPDFFMGKKPSELGYPEDLTQFWETSLENVFTRGEMRVDEFTAMNEDKPRYYQVYVVPEREADQSIISVMTIGRDITSLRQAEESTRRLAEELQRSNQELEQFAYVASHDLQEPLRAITSFTQLLAKEYKEQLDDDADMYIEFIVDGTTRMQQLIRDLLSYSRVGRHELQHQSVDCNALLEQVKKDLQVAIAENQAMITADPLPIIMADPNQIANCLQNLISNSLKYRSDLAPQIHISARKRTLDVTNALIHDSFSNLAPSEEWLFSLQDNGIGIEPQYAERIFGIFQRLHTSDEYSGTGLGLAICRKIIERHNGRIWVESQWGQGSTFFFTLPLSTKAHDDNPRPITQNSTR